MTIFNHYSFLMLAGLALALTAFGLLRDGYTPRDGVILVVVAALVLFIWLLVRPKSGAMDGVAQLDARRGQGTPLLLELQSPY